MNRTAISQFIYSLGGSAFVAVNGSMMIEVVPFFVIIAQEITNYIGEENPKEIIATTMVAFALSSFLTGKLNLIFFASYFYRFESVKIDDPVLCCRICFLGFGRFETWGFDRFFP
jgi:hypothetical protein